MPVTHGVTGSSPVRTANKFQRNLGLVFVFNKPQRYEQRKKAYRLITSRGEMLLPSVQSAMELNMQEVLHQLLNKDDKTKFVYSPDFESSIVLKLIEIINENKKTFEEITNSTHKLSKLKKLYNSY